MNDAALAIHRHTLRATRSPSRGRASLAAPLRPLAVLSAIAVAAACSSGDGTGPGPGPGPTVASVEIAGAVATIEVGQTLLLTATARDAQNNVVANRSFVWTSSNQGVATVTPAGLVQGVAAGNATISATTEGRSGSYGVTVTAPPPIVLSSVAPNPLVPGQSATLTGSGFSNVPNNNIVTIAGAAATVTSAAPTSLTVTVPATLCTTGTAAVTVRIGNQSSNTIQAPAPVSGTLVNLAVGAQLRVNDPNNFCLRFAASAAAEAYLVGVTAFTESVTTVTPVTVAAATAGAEPALALLPAGPAAMPMSPQLALPIDVRREDRWRRHRADHLALRAQERAQVNPRFLSGPLQAASAVAALSSVPANVVVGDQVPIRVPDRNRNLCTNFTQITTTAAVVTQRVVILTDNANPAGGYTTADLQTIAAQFDGIYDKNAEWFNPPTPGRIAIVITASINQFEILGFVSTSDLNPACASSNNDKIFYARSPNPAEPNERLRYTREEAMVDAPVLLAHELVHIIQFTVRLSRQPPAQFQIIWELEGQATFAEFVNGFAATGRQFGQNYGFNVAFNQGAEAAPNEWFVGAFIDLVLYYGFNGNCDPNVMGQCDIPIAGAPEQCSWLDLQTNGNTGPCFPGREVYGVPALLFNWLSDHFGPGSPGGRQDVQKRLINSSLRGFANVQAAVGESMETLLPEWAASFYIDDRVPGAPARLTHPSWNLFNFETRLRRSATLVPRERGFTTFSDNVQVRGGSTAYFRVSGTGRNAVTIRARGASESILPAIMRMWVVRLQ